MTQPKPIVSMQGVLRDIRVTYSREQARPYRSKELTAGLFEGIRELPEQVRSVVYKHDQMNIRPFFSGYNN